MRLIKKLFLFVTELAFLFLGCLSSIGFAPELYSTGHKSGPVVFIVIFSFVWIALAWFRRKTGKWTAAADAEAFLAHRSWQRLHPRSAKYFRMVRPLLTWLPSLVAAFVLFFLPVTSHFFYVGRSIIPHYRVSVPLNWLVVEYQSAGRLFFSEEGAARYGLTPLWFNGRMPSGVVFLITDPEHGDGWDRPERELASGHTTHTEVRDFRLGMLTSSCYEYRYIFENAPVLWESLCATHPNGINYNLRTAFFGRREDLPAFYKMLNSAATSLINAVFRPSRVLVRDLSSFPT